MSEPNPISTLLKGGAGAALVALLVGEDPGGLIDWIHTQIVELSYTYPKALMLVIGLLVVLTLVANSLKKTYSDADEKPPRWVRFVINLMPTYTRPEPKPSDPPAAGGV